MTNEDFIALEAGLRESFRRLGVPEIADSIYFRVRDGVPTDELSSPRERVAAQIDALERYFSTYDRQVYDESMRNIRNVLSDSPRRGARSPNRAVVLLPDASGLTGNEEQFPLSKLPRLKTLRSRLGRLAQRIREEQLDG
jgi:hypothetical protein